MRSVSLIEVTVISFMYNPFVIFIKTLNSETKYKKEYIMGIMACYLSLYEQHINPLRKTESITKMIELGAQRMSGEFKVNYGYEYFKDLGYEVTSIDVIPEGYAVIKDLRINSHFEEWPEHFDVLTNFGTIEHVSPTKNHYDVWKICHDIVRPGGYFYHVMPDSEILKTDGLWWGHCNHYYNKEFFELLAKENNYSILGVEYHLANLVLLYKKNLDSEFKITPEKLVDAITVL